MASKRIQRISPKRNFFMRIVIGLCSICALYYYYFSANQLELSSRLNYSYNHNSPESPNPLLLNVNVAHVDKFWQVLNLSITSDICTHSTSHNNKTTNAHVSKHDKVCAKHAHERVRILIYGAYLDMRSKDRCRVRVLCMANLRNSTRMRVHAMLWHQQVYLNAAHAQISDVCEVRLAWNRQWGIGVSHLPYLLTCDFDDDIKSHMDETGHVAFVSLIEKRNDIVMNRFRVDYFGEYMESLNNRTEDLLDFQLNPISTKITIRWNEVEYFNLDIFSTPRGYGDFAIPNGLRKYRTLNFLKNIQGDQENPYQQESTNEPKETSAITFGVCVKGLRIKKSNLAERLVEWIELLRILGASKIYMYDIDTCAKAKQVLTYYQAIGYIEVVGMSVPTESKWIHNPSLTKRHNEIIAYNDCFYRHYWKYDFIAVMDIDEVIVPLKVLTWQQLFETLRTKFTPGDFEKINSICIRNVYFLDEFRKNVIYVKVPKHMHMLQHVRRTINSSRLGDYCKCFHSSKSSTILLHNHFALACEPSKCQFHHVDYRLAQLNHYRKECHASGKNKCDVVKQTVKDFTLWRYRERLVSAVDLARQKIGF